MPNALKPCSTPGCPELVATGRCDECEAKADRARGTARQRGYDHKHEALFKRAVLAKHPICVICRRARSQHADHHPLSRRELVRLGLNPNDPKHGRGVCHSCHSTETAEHQPGGWNAAH